MCQENTKMCKKKEQERKEGYMGWFRGKTEKVGWCIYIIITVNQRNNLKINAIQKNKRIYYINISL